MCVGWEGGGRYLVRCKGSSLSCVLYFFLICLIVLSFYVFHVRCFLGSVFQMFSRRVRVDFFVLSAQVAIFLKLSNMGPIYSWVLISVATFILIRG